MPGNSFFFLDFESGSSSFVESDIVCLCYAHLFFTLKFHFPQKDWDILCTMSVLKMSFSMQQCKNATARKWNSTTYIAFLYSFMMKVQVHYL
jgi:hypothetical protein